MSDHIAKTFRRFRPVVLLLSAATLCAASTNEHLSVGRLTEILEVRTTYGDTMFVPPRARWNEAWTETREDNTTQPRPALKDTQTGIGEMLNKAIAALEDDNEALHGVLKGNINFNEQVAGKPKVKNDDLKDLLDHFTKSVDGQGVPLVNDAFEFPDLLRAAYEYLIKEFADSAGKKGGQLSLLQNPRAGTAAPRHSPPGSDFCCEGGFLG